MFFSWWAAVRLLKSKLNHQIVALQEASRKKTLKFNPLEKSIAKGSEDRRAKEEARDVWVFD